MRQAMIALIVFMVGSYGMGRFVLWKTRVGFPGALENSIYSIGIGLGAWCYALFFLGHAGLLYPWLLMSLALASALPASVWIAKTALRTPIRFPKINVRLFDALAVLAASAILAITLVCCFSPVTGGISNDEIATHLSAPKSWLALHKITALADPSSAIAGHVELLFLWVMAFAPEFGPKLFSWISLVLCVALVYCFTKEKIGKRPALFACIFIVINPLIFRESCTAFTDVPAAFFLLAAIGALWRMAASNNKKTLVFSAFFLGVGCGAKPTVYFYVPAIFFLCAVVLFTLRERGVKLVKSLATFGILVFLFAAPWPVRNAILSGSPTFPPPLFLYDLHHGKPFVFSGHPFEKKDADALYDYYRSRIQKHGTGVKNFFLLPWNITMHPESLSIGDSVGTVMLSFLPIVFFFRRRPSWLNAVLIFCFIATGCVYFFIIPEARYFIAVFFALAPVLAWTVENVRRRSRRIASLVKIVVLCNCVFSCAVAIRKFYPECQAAVNPDRRRPYCRENTPFYEAFEFCNKEKPRDLVVFYDNQVFYYLTTGYRVDAKALETIASYPDAYLLDIDYSQTPGRDPKTQSNAYCIREIPPFLKLIFTGPDARIYRVGR